MSVYRGRGRSVGRSVGARELYIYSGSGSGSAVVEADDADLHRREGGRQMSVIVQCAAHLTDLCDDETRERERERGRNNETRRNEKDSESDFRYFGEEVQIRK